MIQLIHLIHRLFSALFLLSALFLMIGCGEDVEGITFNQNEAYMVALVDDEFLEFDLDLLAHQNDPYSLAMIGHSADTGKTVRSLQLTIFNSPAAIAPQTYQANSNEALMLVTYSRSEKDEKGRHFHQENFTASTASPAVADDFVIIIEDMTDAYVKGSFSGTVVVQNGNTTTSLNITDGEFLIPLE